MPPTNSEALATLKTLPDVAAPFRVVPCGLVVDGAATFDQWERAGEAIYAGGSWVRWALGDWVLAGEARFGELASQAFDATKRRYQTVANAASVCRRFPLSRRRESLSFSHHAEVAGRPSHEADRLLDEAQLHGWSADDLREHVRALRGATDTSTMPVVSGVAPVAKTRGATAGPKRSPPPLVRVVGHCIDTLSGAIADADGSTRARVAPSLAALQALADDLSRTPLPFTPLEDADVFLV